MGFFSRKPKIKFPDFQIGAFGKLPFYKDFLYSSFGEPFSILKNSFDQGFDQIIKNHEKPYVFPDRNALLHLKDLKIDLVLSIWDSHDGLRSFPFTLATIFPKKFKNQPFPQFIQALQQYWDYFSRYYEHLKDSQDSQEFYSRVRNRLHSLPDHEIEETELTDQIQQHIPQWNRRFGAYEALEVDMSLDPEMEHTLLSNCQPTKNPDLLLWPQKGWQNDAEICQVIVGSDTLENFNFTWFLPRKLAKELDPSEAATDQMETLPKETDS